ncbi:hypothetical protein BGZ94_008467 [Podila epigama]|nr:hypothetical protein BGZ94_008467 [Podila epigama]
MLIDDLPTEPVKVIIAGAGLGGMLLGLLLEMAQISYVIFEQSDRVMRLGSGMAITANIFPLFEQLGLLPEIIARSKEFDMVEGYNEKMKLVLPMNHGYAKKLSAYLPRIITHPDLYEILSSRVPSHKVVRSRRVVHVDQDEKSVRVHFPDGSSFQAQVLVGADGAHSAVRQAIYTPLADKGELPRADKEPVHHNGVCLVGETKPLKVEKFPRLHDVYSSAQVVYSEKRPYYWATTTTPNNTICWILIEFFDKAKLHEVEYIRRWQSTPAGEMCEAVKDFPIPCGVNLTLEDLMAETSRSLVSKVMNEEKFYSTWYSGRTVLLGDACHKMSLAGGLGAITAFQDAAVLANYLHSLPSTETWHPNDITHAFKGYKAERFSSAKYACELSHSFGQMTGKKWASEMTRALAAHTPEWLWKIAMRKIIANRPQVSFLPLVDSRGSIKAMPQPSLHLARGDSDKTSVSSRSSKTKAAVAV